MVIQPQKKEYIPPKIEVFFVEMENGVAANSANVSPSLTQGNVNEIPTNWEGTDNDSTDIFTSF